MVSKAIFHSVTSQKYEFWQSWGFSDYYVNLWKISAFTLRYLYFEFLRKHYFLSSDLELGIWNVGDKFCGYHTIAHFCNTEL